MLETDDSNVVTCLICLVKDNLININDVDTNKIKWKSKLSYCIPELDWNFICFLCQFCASQLDLLCTFRNQCVNSHLGRKLDEVKSEIKCKYCLKSFNFRNELTEHNKLTHHLECAHDCSYCDESYNVSHDLIKHEDEHFNLHEHMCKSCKVSFKHESALINHNLFRHTEPSDWGFACKRCELKFPNGESLLAHVKTVHNDLTSYACFNCGESFARKTLLANHIRNCVDKNDAKPIKKTYTCEHCNLICNTKKKLEIHKVDCESVLHEVKSESDVESVKEKKIKTKEKIKAKCDLCGIVFSTKYLINRHVRNVHAKEKLHNCDECGQKFASPVYLAAHKKYHSRDRTHICSFCGKGFITASDLYHHEKIHENKRAYKCEKCPKAFNTSSDLHKHRTCVHSDRSEWKYVCSYCNKRFPSKINLDTHIKIHTGEKNYACHLCEHRCITRSVLQRHIKSHSNVKSFKCNYCSQDYKYQKTLDVHLTRVHGIGDAKIPIRVKKYFCHICPKAFFANNKLQKHIRSHTGERPFSCSMCDKRFIDKSYVKQHLKTAHNVSNDCNDKV